MTHTNVIDFRLDGFAAHLPPVQLASGRHHSLATHEPVVALTLTRDSGHGREVLVCVRDPADNRTHPNVLSSPTMRVRDVHALPTLADPDSTDRDLLAALAPTAETLLRTKVGVAAAAACQLAPDAVSVWQGDSVIGRDVDGLITEPLTMFNMHVDLPIWLNLPRQTASYSAQLWVPEETHTRLCETGDPFVAGVTYRDGAPLVYGLCTASTRRMLARTRRDERAGDRELVTRRG